MAGDIALRLGWQGQRNSREPRTALLDAAPKPRESLLMRSLGPYELTRRLGAGGMGEVWMGHRQMGGATKSVAIKLISAEKARDVSAKKMFLEEARLSMLLNNSNIVQVFDVGETAEGTCYMAMEWVDGLNLSELADDLRVAGEKMPAAMIAYIIGEVLKALAYAHDLKHDGVRHTIVHRDVSPHNVMLSVSGEVKLMDFGIARLATEDTSGVHVKGKLRYMPPEQFRGDSRAPTIDLFAVGAILHELLDGQRFRGEVAEEQHLYKMIFEGAVPPMANPTEKIIL